MPPFGWISLKFFIPISILAEENMSKVAIVTDSTAYLPPTFVHQYNIGVVPLTVILEEESFRDGVDINPSEFYTRL
jgi:hypothetical protein